MFTLGTKIKLEKKDGSNIVIGSYGGSFNSLKTSTIVGVITEKDTSLLNDFKLECEGILEGTNVSFSEKTINENYNVTIIKEGYDKVYSLTEKLEMALKQLQEYSDNDLVIADGKEYSIEETLEELKKLN